jgi:broad specificity phosphatase PhoE
MGKIVLVRHGETDFNLNNINQGSEVDPPLNNTGKIQAKITGEYMMNYIDFDTIYSSPLIRAKETAEIIRTFQNPNIEIIYDELLVERSKGMLSGKNEQEEKEIIQSMPTVEEIAIKINKMNSFEKAIKFEEIHDLEAKMYTELKMETRQEVSERIKDFFSRIDKTKNTLIVCHGSFIGVTIRTLCNVEELNKSNLLKETTNCSITVIENSERPRLLLSLYNRHLKNLYTDTKS